MAIKISVCGHDFVSFMDPYFQPAFPQYPIKYGTIAPQFWFHGLIINAELQNSANQS